MREGAVELLACPHCGERLRRSGGSLRCARGHSYDLARQGHVTLLTGRRPRGGDSPAMVEARAAFLAARHLAPLTERVTALAGALLASGPPGGVVELGAGTGRQLAEVLERAPGRTGLALDLSAAAARRAARAHGRLGAVVCDVWRGLPVRHGAAALVLDVFAPRNGAEIRRVLHPHGCLLLASPAPEHLAELVGPLGLLTVDADKPRRVAEALDPHLERVASERCEFVMELEHGDAIRLVEMGPSAWHADRRQVRERLAALPSPLRVGAAVELATYRPRPRPAAADAR